MRLDDEFALMPSALEVKPVKLHLKGWVWLYPLATPKVTPTPSRSLMEGNTVTIWAGYDELGVKYKLSKDVRK